MEQWEYMELEMLSSIETVFWTVSGDDALHIPDGTKLIDALNLAGARGWELATDGPKLLFKRKGPV